MDRLEGLFYYLNSLCNVNGAHGSSSFSVQKAIVRTCIEIEKELGIEEPKGDIYNINVETQINNQQKVTNEMIERALSKFPKIY